MANIILDLQTRPPALIYKLYPSICNYLGAYVHVPKIATLLNRMKPTPSDFLSFRKALSQQLKGNGSFGRLIDTIDEMKRVCEI